MASNRRERRVSRWGTSRIRCMRVPAGAPVDDGAGAAVAGLMPAGLVALLLAVDRRPL